MLQYKIPFNKDLFIEQTKLSLPYEFSDLRKKVKISFLITVAWIVIGIIILLFGSDVSSMFFVLAVFQLFIVHNNHELYNRSKNDFMRLIKEHLKNDLIITFELFEFLDDSLRISNDLFCSKIGWNEIDHIKLRKNSIFLILKEAEFSTIAISESEVGAFEFQKIQDFINSKIQ